MNFTVNYNDMTENPRGVQGIKNTLEGVIRGSITNVAGQLLDKDELKLRGAKGRQFAYQFADNEDNSSRKLKLNIFFVDQYSSRAFKPAREFIKLKRGDRHDTRCGLGPHLPDFSDFSSIQPPRFCQN